MPLGIYVMKVKPGREKEIKRILLEEFGFDEVHIVTGTFDVIGKIFLPLSRRGFEELKDNIQKLDGIKEVKYLEALD